MQEIKEIHIRAFWAVKDKESSMRFVEGHRNVLDNVGVKEVTSSSDEWVDDPNVMVILIADADGQTIYGGSRIHLASEDNTLPIIAATEKIDTGIHEVVGKRLLEGTAEICGLWNSLEVAGYGVGSIYAIRSALSLLPQLGIKSCFALCSPFTAKLVNRNYGTKTETSIGDNGTFYYPKIDLLATIVVLEDSKTLEGSREEEKSIIQDLVENPIQVKKEKGPKGEVTVHYNLRIKEERVENA